MIMSSSNGLIHKSLLWSCPDRPQPCNSLSYILFCSCLQNVFHMGVSQRATIIGLVNVPVWQTVWLHVNNSIIVLKQTTRNLENLIVLNYKHAVLGT